MLLPLGGVLLFGGVPLGEPLGVSNGAMLGGGAPPGGKSGESPFIDGPMSPLEVGELTCPERACTPSC
jgi:hypothetical protein